MLSERDKAVFLDGLNKGLRLMLEATEATHVHDPPGPCTASNCEPHTRGGQWFGAALKALNFNPDQNCTDDINQVLGEVREAVSDALPVSARPPQDRN